MRSFIGPPDSLEIMASFGGEFGDGQRPGVSEQQSETQGQDGLTSPNLPSSIVAPSSGIILSPDGFGSRLQGNDPATGKSVIAEFLQAHTCYDLMHQSGKIVVFDTRIAVNLAFFALAEHNIKCVPLWDTDQQQLVGMMTTSDFVNIIRHLYYDDSPSNSIMDKLSSISIADWRKTSGQDLSRGLLSVSPEDTLFKACKYMNTHNIHRLPLIDHVQLNVLKVVTHFSFLEYLCSTFRDTRELFETTVEELGIGKWNDLILLPVSASLMRVIDAMAENHVAAVPLLDENGVVVDLYCRSNVTLLAHEGQLALLESPVADVLAHQRAEGLVTEPLCTCRLTDPLRTVFEVFAAARVHRLVCVDDAGHALGIVSLRDLFRYFVE